MTNQTLGCWTSRSTWTDWQPEALVVGQQQRSPTPWTMRCTTARRRRRRQPRAWSRVEEVENEKISFFVCDISSFSRLLDFWKWHGQLPTPQRKPGLTTCGTTVEQRRRRRTAAPAQRQPASSQMERRMTMTTPTMTATSKVLTASRQPSAKK